MGEAPHKPLLLLTVLKAAERDGDLSEVLLLSPELVYQFKLFEHIVAHRRKQKLDIRMPFHHVKSSGVYWLVHQTKRRRWCKGPLTTGVNPGGVK